MMGKKYFAAGYVFRDGRMSNDKEIIDIVNRITGKVFDVNSEIKDNTNSLCCQLDFRK